MLMLDRQQGQTIRIGSDIVVKIVKTGRSRVKVGVEAPNRRILRGELSGEQADLCVLSMRRPSPYRLAFAGEVN